jgi:hypothetical protein
MKKSYKKILYILVACVALFIIVFLTGCSDNETNHQIGKDTGGKGDRLCSGQCVHPSNMKVSPTERVVTPDHGVPAPKFKDFPSGPVYTGPTAKLVLDNEFAKIYRTRLRIALTDKPVFASEYVSETIQCGTCCTTTTLVSKRTGKVLKDWFGGAGPYVTDARVDSKLLMAEGPVLDKDLKNWTGYATYFYVLKDDRMRLIKAIPTNPPPPCSNYPCPSCDYGSKDWDY